MKFKKKTYQVDRFEFSPCMCKTIQRSSRRQCRFTQKKTTISLLVHSIFFSFAANYDYHNIVQRSASIQRHKLFRCENCVNPIFINVLNSLNEAGKLVPIACAHQMTCNNTQTHTFTRLVRHFSLCLVKTVE